jgi:hypothetical protein
MSILEFIVYATQVMEAITLRKKHPSLWLKQNHEEDTPLPSCYSLVQQW